MKSLFSRLTTLNTTVLLGAFSTATLALATMQQIFHDIGDDVYAQEIQEAVTAGLVVGFSKDNTFRPQALLTREQLVSMVLEALSRLPVSPNTVPSHPSPTWQSPANARPYWDVMTSRWSAAKIQFARDYDLIQGYSDGSFRPTQPATRAELIALLHNAVNYAANYGQITQGYTPRSSMTQPPVVFSDTANHWAKQVISQMSSYCRVTSPVNETGNAFAPDSAVQRNYAAAATLRMLNCIEP